MDNKQVTKIGEKTKHLIAKVKDVLGGSEKAALEFIMICLMFDVKAMDFSKNKDLDERTIKAIDMLVNDEEFKQLLDELKEDVKKARENK